MSSIKTSSWARYPLAALLALTIGLVWTSFAMADAGNPILNTMRGTIDPPNAGPNDPVTVYVRGQWDWLSHGGDCNQFTTASQGFTQADRAGTGVAMIWNDPNGRTVGTNEVVRISRTATGNFTLKWKNPSGTNLVTGTLSNTTTAAQMDAALESAFGTAPSGDFTVTGAGTTADPWTVTFGGDFAELNVNPIQRNNGIALTFSYTEGTNGTAFNGYPLAGTAIGPGGADVDITAYIGVKTAAGGNLVDGLIHPVDLGNQPENYTRAGTDYPGGQQFFDPGAGFPSAKGTGTTVAYPTSTWKAGCGRMPLSAVDAPRTGTPPPPAPESTGLRCGSGAAAGQAPDAAKSNGDCAGEPWGSWGYLKNGGRGYSHAYAKRSDLTSICVNFYDQHGTAQVSSSSLDVLGNGDNSLGTNRFNLSQGANCLFFPQIITTATDGTVGDSITDSASLTGVPANAGGTLTFRAYKRTNLGDAPDCVAGKLKFTSSAIPVSGPGTYGSGNFDTGAANAGAGRYDWQVVYSGGGGIQSVTTVCGDSSGGNDETSDVSKKQPKVSTDAGPTIRFDPVSGNDLFDVATLTEGFSPTGTITFHLYKGADCSAANEVPLSPVGISSTFGTQDGFVHGNGTYRSTSIHVTLPGQYRWIANYDGDANNFATANACNQIDPPATVTHENVLVENPSISIDKSPDNTVVRTGSTVTFTILVKNTGDTVLTNVTVTDALTSSCARTIGTLAANNNAAGGPDEFSYTCTTAALTASFTNSATATGTPPTGPNVTSTDTAPVTVIHPQIDVSKDPKEQSVPSGGTATWTITVKNTGDVALDHVTITDAQAPGCARPNAANPSDLGTLAANDNAAGGADETSYTCTRTGITANFVNIVQACGNPNPDSNPAGPAVCDDDNTGGGPPGCPEADRCGEVTVSDVTTKQDFNPRDTATVTGLGANPGGTLTWALYKDAAGLKTCDASHLIYSDSRTGAAFTGNGDYTTISPDLLSALNNAAGFGMGTGGNYNWKVSYSGNAATNNAAIPGTCGEENFQIDNG